MYYRCQKYYHCSCAKSIGFIRDLESMQFENSDTYIPPYCQQHLEQRVLDCSAKAKKYQNLGDEGKASSFSQMMAAYEGRLPLMQHSLRIWPRVPKSIEAKRKFESKCTTKQETKKNFWKNSASAALRKASAATISPISSTLSSIGIIPSQTLKLVNRVDLFFLKDWGKSGG